jgi:hypothetical protein
VQAQLVVEDARNRADAPPREEVHDLRAGSEAEEALVLEDLVHRQRPRDRLVPVVGHEDDEIVVIHPLEQRPELTVEQAVETTDALGDRGRGSLRVQRMPGMDVLEEAVLGAVGRDEDEAGGVPRLLVQERAHRRGPPPRDVLELVDELHRLVPERRPRAAVDGPIETRPGLFRIAVGPARRNGPSGDHHTADLGRGVG